MAEQPTKPQDAIRKEYEAFEKRMAAVSDGVVGSQGFAEALSMLTSNAVALTRAASIGVEQLVSLTRLAGRRDIARLGRQLARTEDKLEQVLQVVEQLETDLAQTRSERDEVRRGSGGRAAGGQARNGSANGSARTARGTRSAEASVTATDTRLGS